MNDTGTCSTARPRRTVACRTALASVVCSGLMSEGFAYLDILFFAMVAAFVALRLRSVLGRRTGNERRRTTPPPTANGDNVVSLPDRGKSAATEDAGVADISDATIKTGLAEIRAADPRFEVQPFLQGAKAAFGLIVEAFAAGDKESLKPLLAPISHRERCGG